MDMKVHDINQVSQIPETSKTAEADGSFKFTLASAITDAELQARVDALLNDITAQGNRIAQHMDIRDMTLSGQERWNSDPRTTNLLMAQESLYSWRVSTPMTISTFLMMSLQWIS